MGPYQKLNTEKAEIACEDVRLNDVAFEAFFKEHFVPLCTYCKYRFNFDLDLAKEAVNTAFIKLWEHRQRISPNLSLKAYIYKITVNTSLDILRRQKQQNKYDEVLDDDIACGDNFFNYAGGDYKKMKNEIDEAVNNLPGQMRLIFELSRYEGLKYSEIGARLNISVKTVETQMSRALIKLRQRLAHYLQVMLLIVACQKFL